MNADNVTICLLLVLHFSVWFLERRLAKAFNAAYYANAPLVLRVRLTSHSTLVLQQLMAGRFEMKQKAKYVLFRTRPPTLHAIAFFGLLKEGSQGTMVIHLKAYWSYLLPAVTVPVVFLLRSDFGFLTCFLLLVIGLGFLYGLVLLMIGLPQFYRFTRVQRSCKSE
jgi:hypothetical protein